MKGVGGAGEDFLSAVETEALLMSAVWYSLTDFMRRRGMHVMMHELCKPTLGSCIKPAMDSEHGERTRGQVLWLRRS